MKNSQGDHYDIKTLRIGKHEMACLIRASIFSICCLLMQRSIGFAQSISGSTCVMGGTQYTYNFSGNDNASTVWNWSVTNGTFSGAHSGTGFAFRHVNIIWNSTPGSGNVSVTTSNAGNASLNVTITVALIPGAISSGKSQSLTYNTVPAAINCPAATGGYCTPAYTYQWQSSPDNVTYTNVSGATALNLSFSTGLTQTKYYRRMVTETNSGTIGYSDVATVLVYPQLLGGTVAGSTLISYNTAPPAFSSTVDPSGGNPNFTMAYKWQQSTDNVNFTDMNSFTQKTMTSGPLTTTTYFRRKTTRTTETAYSNTITVTVNPPFSAGLIVQPVYNIASNTSPGAIITSPASGGNCSGSFTYQWQSSANNITYADIAGATNLYYTPGNLTASIYYRRKATCGIDLQYTNICQVIVGTPLAILNYIKVRDITKPAVIDAATAAALTDPNDVKQTTQYFDGLGRITQTVARQASPLLKDLVSVDMYDLAAREVLKYLPYVATTNDGNSKSYPVSELLTFNSTQFTGENYYAGYASIEASSLNRTLTSYAPGSNWLGSQRGVASQSMVNSDADSVRIWYISMTAGSLPTSTTRYAAGQLYVGTTTDEQAHQVVEYKDKEGHTILKKVQLSSTPGTAHVGWLCTYYVYDDLNNLRFVLQPRAVELINSNWTLTQAIADELCFRYEYDSRSRMIIKKIPGAGEVWMVYDADDRLVLSQDANTRAAMHWLFTQYDKLDRPTATGFIADFHDRTYHANLAANSTAYPNLGSYTYAVYTGTYYDDYSWISGSGTSFTATRNTTWDASFLAPSNLLPFPQALTQSNNTRGLVTGKRVQNLTSSVMMFSINYYDDRSRILQAQSYNVTGGIDIATSQYDFSGKTLRTHMKQEKQGTNAQTHYILTKLAYDQAGRLSTVYKNIDNAGSDQLIATNTYNELGQLQNKQLGNNLENLAYGYNIRGWLSTINKNFVAGGTGSYFGMELGYDKTASVNTTTTYAGAQYNGNITGTIWKTSGDGIGRKYDFTYDNINRLTAANFNQNSSGSTWDHTAFDFTANNLTYDANGNILSMNQKGFKSLAVATIDQLTYTYQSGSNKLLQVNDAVNDAQSKLGDFHYTGTKQATDYAYDVNGNLTLDNNKSISAISYNYLNLPGQVTITAKGTITYTYDAAGNKLQKITVDNTVIPAKTTTTTYLGGIVYQNDTLQFIAHEEGRIRWAYHKYTNGATAYAFEYDYFVKDHLGNTRVLLTQQKDTAKYIATMEGAYRSTETQFFGNITNTVYPRTGASGYPVDLTVTNPNDSVARVNGSGQKVGPNLLLKVMSGDKVDIGVQYYFNNLGTPGTPVSSFNDVLNSLANGIVTMTAGSKGVVTDFTNPAGPVYTGLNSFLTANDPTPGTKPKAYLNWILLDEQMKYVNSYPQSGAAAVATAGTNGGVLQAPLGYTGIPITKNGYLYIWVSNETPSWDVFFDNLSVKHYTGPLLEETHYYPFGLTMAGISSQALKPKYFENKYRYNEGSELQNKEFSDGSGLEEYETHFRTLDPQIGRWSQIDPRPNESESPYCSMSNNPVLQNDPLGDSSILGDIFKAVQSGVSWINENLNPLNDAIELITGRDYNLEGAPRVNRMDAAVGIGLTLVGGKVEGAVARSVENAVAKDAIQVTEKAGAKTVEGITKINGNSKSSTVPATLYRLETKSGEYLKTGITGKSIPEKRYSNAFMKDKNMIKLDKGARAKMLEKERDIVEKDPGTLNKEPWAGRKKNQR